MAYLHRILDLELDELFGEVPALAIDGPKGVGKTTTAEQRVVGILRLDSKAQRESIAAEPEQVLRRPRPLLIDEWQKVPEVWDVVRRQVGIDRGRRRAHAASRAGIGARRPSRSSST